MGLLLLFLVVLLVVLLLLVVMRMMVLLLLVVVPRMMVLLVVMVVPLPGAAGSPWRRPCRSRTTAAHGPGACVLGSSVEGQRRHTLL
jgi:hypothetical protein